MMKEINWKRKLTSRKFWTAVASFTSIYISLENGFDILGGRPSGRLLFIHDIDHGFLFASSNSYHDIFFEIVVGVSLIYIELVFVCWLDFPYKDRYGGTLLFYDCGV